jgi:hypothetical protein
VTCRNILLGDGDTWRCLDNALSNSDHSYILIAIISVIVLLLIGAILLDRHFRKEEIGLLRDIDRTEREILRQLKNQHLPTGMVIQIQGGIMATQAGGTSVFQEVPTPTGAIFPAGTTFVWTVDDTADITLTPSPDGTQVTAVCVASPTGTSYNLTCQSSYIPPGATTGVSGTLNVPIIVTPPAPTGITINQLS